MMISEKVFYWGGGLLYFRIYSAWINQNCHEAPAGIAKKTSSDILFPTRLFWLDERPNLRNKTGLEAVFSAQV